MSKSPRPSTRQAGRLLSAYAFRPDFPPIEATLPAYQAELRFFGVPARRVDIVEKIGYDWNI